MKFDIYDFFHKNVLKEQGEDQQAVDQNVQKQQEQPPAAQQQVVQTPFDRFTGAVIKNIKFQKHENGGSITIYTSLSSLPLIISWIGDRVTVKYKDVTAL